MLRWDWNNRIGTLTLKNGQEISVYEGNALAILIWENKEQYQMYQFFCDKQHLRNCVKEYTPFEQWEKLELYKVSTNMWALIKEAVKAHVQVIITTSNPF